MGVNELNFVCSPSKKLLGCTPLTLLRQLQGPSVIDIEGFDNSRWRVVSVLVHGNEPSGLIAMHHWLQEGHKPACNFRFIVSSVEAALTDEYFSQRFLARDADLNRCFAASGPEHMQARASAILHAIREVQPEAVIDLHNTSGSGPGFGVSLKDNDAHRALVSFFCDAMIVTALRIGSLMEQDFGCPVVTIECGGGKDSSSHRLALIGLSQFANAMSVAEAEQAEKVQALYHPLRVMLNPEMCLTYSHEQQTEYDVCLLQDIEQYNTGLTKANTLLGWVRDENADHFLSIEQTGQLSSRALFYVQERMLFSKYDMRIFMATSNVAIARQDCLFYSILDT